MYRIIQKRNYLFGLSLILLIPGIVGFAIWGLRLGIDFTGGSLVRLNFASTPPSAQVVQDVATQAGLQSVIVQETGDHGLTVRTEAMSNEQRTKFLEQLQSKDVTTVQESFESIGPTIGNELKRKAITATAIVLLIIVL